MVSALLLTVGCISVKYIGDEYPPTKQVKIFFTKKEVPKPYKIIGKAIITTPSGFYVSDIQDEIKDKAEAVGANAVLITSFRQAPSGMVSNTDVWQEGGWASDGPFGFFGPYDGGWVYPGNPFGNETWQTENSLEYQTRVVGLFIRYCKPEEKAVKPEKKK